MFSLNELHTLALTCKHIIDLRKRAYLYPVCSFFFVCLLFYSPANASKDSLLQVLKTGQPKDTSLARLYIKLSGAYAKLNPDSAQFYADNVFQVLSASSCPPKSACYFLLADAYLQKGEIYLLIGNLKEAEKNMQKAFDMYQSASTSSHKARMCIELGTVYDYQGRTKDALDIYKKGYSMYMQVNDSTGMAYALNNIGVILYTQGEIQQAIEYLEKSVHIYKNVGEYVQLGWTLNNLGNMYLKIHYDKKAYALYRNAFALAQTYDMPEVKAYNLKNLGNFYALKEQYDSALYYHTECLQVYANMKNISGVILSHVNIGAVYVKLKEYTKALNHGEKANALLKEIDVAARKLEVAELLKNIYTHTWQYEKALHYTNVWILLKDSLENDGNKRNAMRMTMQHEYEMKLVADSVAQAAREAQTTLAYEENMKRQRIYTYAGLGGFMLMLLVAIVSVRAYWQKKKSNRIISEQKKLVEQKQQEVLDSIRYAKRIQDAVLPRLHTIGKNIRKCKKSASAGG